MAKGFILDKNDVGEYFISFKRDNNDLDLRVQGESPSTAITHDEITRILEKHGLSTAGTSPACAGRRARWRRPSAAG